VAIATDTAIVEHAGGKDVAVLLLALAPMAAYVYGALALGWGFNELSGGFFIAGVIIGLAGGLGLTGTIDAYFDGMKTLLPAAVMVAVARSISLVLADGHIIDTILNTMAAPLSQVPASAAALLMIPFHAILHVPVSSVSSQAVLTMPLMVPLADLLGEDEEPKQGVAVLGHELESFFHDRFDPEALDRPRVSQCAARAGKGGDTPAATAARRAQSGRCESSAELQASRVIRWSRPRGEIRERGGSAAPAGTVTASFGLLSAGARSARAPKS